MLGGVALFYRTCHPHTENKFRKLVKFYVKFGIGTSTYLYCGLSFRVNTVERANLYTHVCSNMRSKPRTCVLGLSKKGSPDVTYLKVKSTTTSTSYLRQIVASVQRDQESYLQPCEEGHPGCIITRGHNVMGGYVGSDKDVLHSAPDGGLPW